MDIIFSEKQTVFLSIFTRAMAFYENSLQVLILCRQI